MSYFFITNPIEIIKNGTNRHIIKALRLWIIWAKLGFNISLLQPLSQGNIAVIIVPNP